MGLLDRVLGGATGSQAGASGTSPLIKALMLLLAAKAFTSYTSRPAPHPTGGSDSATPSDTIQTGILKGAPSLQGLGTLLERLTHGGLGGHVKSWVGPGQNEAVAPEQLQTALGPEVLDHLEQETGMPRDKLLAELSRALPQVVDKLTPEGRMPTEQEVAHW